MIKFIFLIFGYTHMQYQIRKDPSYAMVEIELDDGEQIETKPGVMMDRTGGIGNDSDIGGGGGINPLMLAGGVL